MASSRIVSLVLGICAVVLSGAESDGGEIVKRETWAQNGHEYVVVDLQDATWDEAMEDMASILPGFYLATITSQQENDFILALESGCCRWLGGFQDPISETDPTAGWTWVTGEEWLYTNWAFGEPNDGGRPADEQHLQWDGARGWNDCCGSFNGFGYIAEVPEPSTAVLCAFGLMGLAASKRRQQKLNLRSYRFGKGDSPQFTRRGSNHSERDSTAVLR